MTYLLLQTFLLLLASYFLGAIVACMVKRAFFGAQAEEPMHVLVPAQADAPSLPPVVMPPQPVRARSQQTVTPRAIDPVQPKIEVLRRPEPRQMPALLDPMRFERALLGPDFNEGVPRVAIVEIMPAVLEPVTDIYVPPPPPPPPEPEPEPEPPVVDELSPEPAVPEETLAPSEEPPPVIETEPRPGGLAARLRDATTAAAAGAVAAAKAAAAASVAFPGFGGMRRSETEETTEAKHDEDASAEPILDQPPVQASDVVEEAVEESAEAFEPAPEPAIEPEPIAEPAPKIEPEPEPLPEPEPEPEPRAPAKVEAPAPLPTAPIEGGDDFQRIRAIDDTIEQKLKALGVIYFEHIAAWNVPDIRRFSQELAMPGRIDREQWVEQAQILAKGGETYYSRNRKAMLKAKAEAQPAGHAGADTKGLSDNGGTTSSAASAQSATTANTSLVTEGPTGVAAASQGRSVAEMAAAAAAAIAASSASVTRGLKPIEPISPLSKVDPKISMPARITDAIRERESSSASVEINKDTTSTEQSADGPQDDLKRIRGIGVLIEKRLNAMNIRRYEQIANWTSGDIDRVSRMLEFKGRIERESWVEQARILASGGQTEFSRRVDRGEVDTSRET